ncbi:hypothetical protein IWW57_002636 [Coemansia sp. S610]|nr:hypothetical protein IWW57_002636 [Coemansia sp. S610]
MSLSRYSMDSVSSATESSTTLHSTVSSASSATVLDDHSLPSKPSWIGLVKADTKLVDKSLVIDPVLNSHHHVVVALAHRGSGKSTFLSMLAEFLAMHSKHSIETRLECFSKCDLFTKRRPFFDKHFAKCPVIHLDFSQHGSRTYEDALKHFRTSVCRATRDLVNLLPSFFDVPADKNGRVGLYISAKAMKSHIEHVTMLFTDLDKGEGGRVEANALVTGLMEVLDKCLGGQQSVVLIDEFEAPVANIMCEPGIPQGVREDIVLMYSSFYTAVFKVSCNCLLC